MHHPGSPLHLYDGLVKKQIYTSECTESQFCEDKKKNI